MPPMMDRIPEKPKNFKKAVRETLSYASKSPAPFIVVLGLAICSTVFMIVGPNQLGRIANLIHEGIHSESGVDMDAVLSVVFLIGSFYVFSAFTGLIQGLIMAHMTQNIAKSLRSKINAAHTFPYNSI